MMRYRCAGGAALLFLLLGGDRFGFGDVVN